MHVDGVKSFLQSRTMWALAVNALCQLLKAKGYEVGDADQTAIVSYALNTVDFVTIVLAMYYRLTATKVLVATPAK